VPSGMMSGVDSGPRSIKPRSPRAKDMLLLEMQHRVANSLQIIASILLMKARTVQSEETRLQLEDAHKRVLSVAAVQQHLQVTSPGAPIVIGTYLTKLCETLAQSTMVKAGQSL
jgi:two-component sensor histidine kinase